MGNQKLTSRYVATPMMAMLEGVPKPTRVDVSTASTTPSPPGVIGMAASTLARPNATSRATGETRWPYAAMKTHNDAASSVQLAAAHPPARSSSRWSVPSSRIRLASRWTSPLTFDASTNGMCEASASSSFAECSSPRVSRTISTEKPPMAMTPTTAAEM